MDYERILVFGAHADDEFPMAGTMAKLADQGVGVYLVTMTNGNEGYPKPEWRDTIVETRRKEAAEADKVLGVARRWILDVEDMALSLTKATLKECIRIVREARPHAVFTHGPNDRHGDHLATHTVSVQATWHAGEPVAAELGPPWRTPHVYYYKSCTLPLPTVVFDITGYAHKFAEARATQVSQHTLFRRTKRQFLADAARIKRQRPAASERFWIVESNVLPDFLPLSKG